MVIRPKFLFLLPVALTVCTFAVEPPEFKAAAQAMRDQLPDVAMAKLERLLATPKLDDDVLVQTKTRYAEAAVRAGKPLKAIEVSNSFEISTQPELGFWRAVALQSLGQWTEALQVYQSLPKDPAWPFASEVALNRVATLTALGDGKSAMEAVGELEKSPAAGRAKLWKVDLLIRAKKYKEAEGVLSELGSLSAPLKHQQTYLQARLKLEMGLYSEASVQFAELVQPSKSIGRDLHQAALLGQARAQRLAGEKAPGARSLVVLIGENPPPAMLKAAFLEFQLCNTPPDPELNKILEGWAAGNHALTSVEATSALVSAREAEGRVEEALQLCSRFATSHPDSPMVSDILLRQSRMLIAHGKGKEALLLLGPLQKPNQPASVRAWAAEVAAYANVAAGDFSKAAVAFKAVTENTPDAEKKLLATFQSALASVQANQAAESDELLAALPPGESAALRPDILLERGMYAASQASPQAESLLGTFLNEYPEHPRAFTAALALAELALENITAMPESIRDKISSAQRYVKSPQEQEKLSILGLQLDSTNATPEAFAKSVDAYLAAHPESDDRADLLMKLGTRLYSAKEFAAAKARFLQLVELEPDSPLVDAARFCAGKAALGSLAKGCEEEALKLWDKVAQGKGELRLAARFEQAKLDQRRDPVAAMQIFDSILKATPPPDAQMRHNVLCLRGETLLAMHSDNPTKLQEALAGFDQVINAPTASIYWKQQAQVRKGACHELLKEEPAALEAYHEAMNLAGASTAAASQHEPDYFWFFRAGEKAMRILEARSDWKGAVAIAKKLSEAPGPQAVAARERANRLITEHYLWEDE